MFEHRNVSAEQNVGYLKIRLRERHDGLPGEPSVLGQHMTNMAHAEFQKFHEMVFLSSRRRLRIAANPINFVGNVRIPGI